MTLSTKLRGATALFATAATLALANPAFADDDAFDLQSMTPEQREAFGEAVRAYLLENPQVIMEAVAVLEERESQQQAAADVALVDDNAQALFDDGFSCRRPWLEDCLATDQGSRCWNSHVSRLSDGIRQTGR